MPCYWCNLNNHLFQGGVYRFIKHLWSNETSNKRSSSVQNTRLQLKHTLIVNQLTAALHVLYYKCPNILLVRICFLYPGEVKPLLSSYCTQLKKTHTQIILVISSTQYLCSIFITVCVSYRTSQPFFSSEAETSRYSCNHRHCFY